MAHILRLRTNLREMLRTQEPECQAVEPWLPAFLSMPMMDILSRMPRQDYRNQYGIQPIGQGIAEKKR